MSKYSKEFKLKVVKYYLKKVAGFNTVARHFSIPAESTVRKWVHRYEFHGIKGLETNHKKYTGEFKQNVVEYMHTNHLSMQEASFKFNLKGTSTLSKWEHIYYEEGPQALYEERRGKSKNMNSKPRKKKISEQTEKDLIVEVQQLRMENEYLKKLNALVQERINRENKKK